MGGTAHLLHDKCEQEGGSSEVCHVPYCLLQSLYCPIKIRFLALIISNI